MNTVSTKWTCGWSPWMAPAEVARSRAGFSRSHGKPSSTSPLIAAPYPEELRERRESANEMERHLKERQRLEEERKERAKTSYPE